MTIDWQATSCGGKASFDSHALATKVLRRANRNSDVPRMVYRCAFCALYHIGTPGKKRKAKRSRVLEEQDN
jgi:hypothetical protein